MNQELGHLSTVGPARGAAPGRIAVPAATVSGPVLHSLNHNCPVRACPGEADGIASLTTRSTADVSGKIAQIAGTTRRLRVGRW